MFVYLFRNQAEREERRTLVQAGADVTGRVFTPEEVNCCVSDNS